LNTGEAMKRHERRRRLKAAGLVVIFAAAVCAALVPGRYPLKYFGLIRGYAGEYGLDPAFVCAVIHTESKFREDALSPKGASGLMQITRPTADWIAGQIGLNNYSYDGIFEPSLNIRLGCWYISWLLERYGGDEKLALAAYNAGIGNVDKWLLDPDYASGENGLGFIPFRETRDFVSRVASGEKVYGVLIKIMGRFL